MSPTKVATCLATLAIKSADYISCPGAVTLVVDAIPGAKYVHQRSSGGKLAGWADVGTVNERNIMKNLLLVSGLTFKALLIGGIWCGVAGLRHAGPQRDDQIG